ncbi:MAG: cell division protein FtsQ/DivIB [Deltaproteobacteria bacterium]
MNFISKNIIKRIVFIAGAIAIIVILVFAVSHKSETEVANVNVELSSENPVKLINEQDILTFLYKATGTKLNNRDIRQLDIGKLEKLLDGSSYIKNAEIFIATNGVLNIQCELNDPIMRVTGKQRDDFYFDKDGNIIPLSRRATCRVPLLSGNLSSIDFKKINKEGTSAFQLLELGKKINEDHFLNALIEQIYVDNNGKLVLIPKVGDQKLEFGKLTGIDEKLEKIKVFYKTGMAGSGWKKFRILNLEWEGQVVGSI